MEKAKLRLLGTLCLLFAEAMLCAQPKLIYLKNGSFEDIPSPSRAPKDWVDCGFPDETAPDIMPNGAFGVILPAQHGKTYLAMVVRDNSTWERVSQELSSPMEDRKCYEFSIYLAKSTQFIGKSRYTGKPENYIRDVKLKIYGGTSYGHRQQLLAQSSMVTNYNWQKFTFIFTPNQNYNYITLEAFYKTPNLFPYNGNILLDQASAIVPVTCAESVLKNDVTHPVELPTSRNSQLIDSMNSTPIKFTEEALFPSFDVKFTDGQDKILSSGHKMLDKLVETLAAHPRLVIEISVHMNKSLSENEAHRLSAFRARAIEQYLLRKQANHGQFILRCLGNSCPINSDQLKDDDERVELKILGI